MNAQTPTSVPTPASTGRSDPGSAPAPGRVATSWRGAARVHRARWLLNVAVMAAAVLVWTVAVPLAGVDLTVRVGDGLATVTQLSVVSAALLAGGGAWASLTLLERVMTRSRARSVWTWLASGVLLVSLLGPLGATSGAATAVLVLLHLLVGGALVVGTPRVGTSGAGAGSGTEE